MIDDLHDENRKKDRFLSNITAKSLQKGEGYSSLPRKGDGDVAKFPNLTYTSEARESSTYRGPGCMKNWCAIGLFEKYHNTCILKLPLA